MERSELEAEQAYYVESDGLYFWTPDGNGGFWYDTEEEMWDQHEMGDIITITHLED